MPNVFKDYPEVPWKQGWRLTAGPEDPSPFITQSATGSVSLPGADWKLELIAPETPSCSTRMFCNGFSIGGRKNPGINRIDVIITGSGVLCGSFTGFPPPQLTAPSGLRKEADFDWVKNNGASALLMRKETRFALICGEPVLERAVEKAETALDGNLAALLQSETEERKNITRLFSMNARHNPPVALAAENLAARLRERTGAIHGLWSVADGFPAETFSLNELYPLVRAWCLIDPAVALELTLTALTLQQSSGGFPAWIDTGGRLATSAPWPFIAQSFELAWQNNRDPALLKKYLPALRKYVQWAARRFDPHRDRIPAWQSEQELFVPGEFDRGKATPELSVFLIAEIEAVLRLSEENDPSGTGGETLTEERDQLARTLNTIFWNPVQKAFSNVWKAGHYLHEPSFGSFTPLLWKGLDREKQTALLESFEETHGFPGHRDPASWNQEEIDDTAHLPAIHQFMAFEALKNADSARGMVMLFVRRAREGFAAWFERESIEAARQEPAGTGAYALGPVTAALFLTVQAEFEKEISKAPSTAQRILRWGHRRKINKTDLRIASVFLLAILIIHLAYNLPRHKDTDAHMAEAALNYKQGRFTEALRTCRRYPDNTRSLFLQGNLLMLAEQPAQAEEFYRRALTRETESPSALLGLALALQMNGNFKQAEKRYNDFIDIHESRQPEAAALADEFLRLTREQFTKPPKWRRLYALPLMYDLGL
jgi:tetratricopeptide (TPR) repeat protein